MAVYTTYNFILAKYDKSDKSLFCFNLFNRTPVANPVVDKLEDNFIYNSRKHYKISLFNRYTIIF